MSLIKKDELEWEEAKKVHSAFVPLLATQILNRTLDEITEHKKERDEAQKKRLETAIQLLKSDAILCAFPEKTVEALLQQMQKQLKKVGKKKKEKKEKKDKEKTKE